MKAESVARRIAAFLLAMTAIAAVGCSGGRDLAARLANAASPSHLPRVTACWEKELQAAGFEGEYRGTFSFVVAGGTSKISEAEVRSLEPLHAESQPSDGGTPADATNPRDLTAFRACLVEALNASELPTEDDASGSGFRSTSDVSVKGYVIAFTDDSKDTRAEAERRAENILLGPRADRCQGLYTYDPPRAEVDLYTEISQADAAAIRYANDPDQTARELQRKYDLLLELRERLRRVLAEPGLPPANQKRMKAALAENEAAAKAAGAAIGCTPPR